MDAYQVLGWALIALAALTAVLGGFVATHDIRNDKDKP